MDSFKKIVSYSDLSNISSLLCCYDDLKDKFSLSDLYSTYSVIHSLQKYLLEHDLDEYEVTVSKSAEDMSFSMSTN